MATLSEMRALTSKNYVAEQVMNIPDLLQILKIFGQTLQFLHKKIAYKMLNFHGFLSSQKTFGGYFE